LKTKSLYKLIIVTVGKKSLKRQFEMHPTHISTFLFTKNSYLCTQKRGSRKSCRV